MAASPKDDLHSRLVVWLKITLPLIALAILATLFLFSNRIGGEGELPYARVDVEELARQQRITAPEFLGTTMDGAAISLRARSARPAQGTEQAAMDQLAANYLGQDGTSVELRAEEGRMTLDGETVMLDKGVEMTTSAGYRLTAQDLTALTTRTEVSTANPVTAEAPFGTIEAGAMTLSPDPVRPETYVLVFNKGVRMLYQPGP
jgi:lipopolysaccharide export system protein LptC